MRGCLDGKELARVRVLMVKKMRWFGDFGW